MALTLISAINRFLSSQKVFASMHVDTINKFHYVKNYKNLC